MKTVSVSEASSDLAAVLAKAIAGEEIGIRSGDAIVALRPFSLSSGSQSNAELPSSPREALRQLQDDARLTSAQARRYLDEVRAERLADIAPIKSLG